MLAVGCFGDNSEGTGGSMPAIEAPTEIDGGDTVDVSLSVPLEPGRQVQIAFDASVGVFTPQAKTAVADMDGIASFTSKYQSENRSGEVIFSAAVSGRGEMSTYTKPVMVFEAERAGNLIVETATVQESANYLAAWPINVIAGGTLRRFVITAPDMSEATSEVLVGLYSNAPATNSPQNALSRVKTTVVPGVNDIPADPVQLQAGARYWMVVAYAGTPTTARGGTGTTQSGWNSTTFNFAGGLPDVMPPLSTSMLGRRNFYIVLRK